MRKLITLLTGTVLVAGMSLTALNAAGMKCGSGKCGSAMEAPAQKIKACCVAKIAEIKKPACCQVEIKAPSTSMKCGAGKCGSSMDKKVPEPKKEAMKCGSGKCG